MRNVLIVEDDADLRKLYSRVFIDAGYEVTDCESLSKAREKLLQNKYEVILIDLLFPSADALSVIKYIRSKTSLNENAPIVVLTNLTSGNKPRIALRYGADKLLFKAQHTPSSVLSEVEELLALKDKVGIR